MPQTLPPMILDALIAAGGCKCQPDRTKGCHACGRPPSPITNSVNPWKWHAETVDGKFITRRDNPSLSWDEGEKVSNAFIRTDSPRCPTIKIEVDPFKGQKARMFLRNTLGASAPRPDSGDEVPIIGGLSVLVIEIAPDVSKPKDFVRLYIHPDQGVILSTKELFFR
jgi:hypothetical protein